jgi:hypothetical protein
MLTFLVREVPAKEGSPMAKAKISEWYAVSNETGAILAVYGAALGSEANAKAHEIANQTGAKTAVHHGVGPKPSVYMSISMKGPIKWFGGVS